MQVRGRMRDTSTWGQIVDFKRFSEEIQEVASKGIHVKIGNGAETRFWIDYWIGDDSLKNMFPRLFMLSTQKDVTIETMGKWDAGRWIWDFKWRRNLRAWEEETVGELLLAVNRVSLCENKSDERVWSFDKSKSFSVSNFVLQVNTRLMNVDPNNHIGRLPWRNLAPPRAQLHLWFILQERLNTKGRLFKLGAMGIEDDKCILCKEEEESVYHLIFNCKISSRLWHYCVRQWNISMCFPKQPRACFISWLGAPFRRFDKKLWISIFYVTAWSIWNIRNKIVFQNFQPNWEFEKMRLFWLLGTWIRGWCPHFPFSPGQILEEWNVIREWEG